MAEAVPIALSKMEIYLTETIHGEALSDVAGDKAEGLRERVQKIKGELERINDVVEEIRTKYFGVNEVLVGNGLVSEVRKLALHVEHVMDKYFYHALVLRREGTSSHIAVLNEIIDDITDIEREIRQVKELKEQWRGQLIPPIGRDSWPTGRDSWSEPLIQDDEEMELIGVDGPADHLIKFLMDDEEMKLLYIVGLPGVGKTALASELHRRLRGQFELSAYVRMSKWPPFTENDMLEDVLRQVGNLPFRTVSYSSYDLTNRIKDALRGKRYIIVIDSVWDIEAWNAIMDACPRDGCCGSRLIATFPILNVPKTFCNYKFPHLIYELKPLSYLDSTRLFLKGASGSEGICHLDGALTETCDEILKMCDGVPLAITKISSMLAGQPVSKKEVMDSLSCSTDGKIMPELEEVRKSSVLLRCSGPSSGLQACSLYLGMFPEKHKIQRDSLVRKCIAEGFMDSRIGSFSGFLEKANLFFDELISRNVIQPVKEADDHTCSNYQVHPGMHSVLKQVAREKNFAACISSGFDNDSILSCTGNPRRLCICFHDTAVKPAVGVLTPFVRTMVLCGGHFNHASVPLSDMKYLQVLDLQECKGVDNSVVDDVCRFLLLLRYLNLRNAHHVTKLPPQIGDLLFLQSLDLSQTQIRTLPPQIGQLSSSLITLDLSQTEIVSLPKEISKLRYLHNFDVSQTQITTFPEEIGGLGWVRTLDVSQTKIATLPEVIGTIRGLETLDVSQTQITTLPKEIGGLELLKTLDVSQTQIATLPEEIGKLENLETLDVSQTQIGTLPPQIWKLTRLKSLDLRQTGVKEIPKQISQLELLERLLFGQKSSCMVDGGVKLPAAGWDMHFKSLKVLGTVDSRECSMEQLSDQMTTQLTEFAIMLHEGGPDDKRQNQEMLFGIGKLANNLQTLTVYGDYCNSTDEVVVLEADQPSTFFPALVKLRAATARFVGVPSWITKLNTLALVHIRVYKLAQDDFEILGDLPSLTNLSLAVMQVGMSRDQTVITAGAAGFARVEVFAFDCRVLLFNFAEQAMPNLEHLQLRLYGVPAGAADKTPLEVGRLQNLRKVSLRYSVQYAGSARVAKIVAAIKDEAASHANEILFSVNGKEETLPPSDTIGESTSKFTGTEIED